MENTNCNSYNRNKSDCSNKSNGGNCKNPVYIICRGGGDLATGIVHRLHRAGFGVLILETEKPAAIRRQVSFCEAIYDGSTCVEGVTCVKIDRADEAAEMIRQGMVPLLVDPKGESIEKLKPSVVVDAIIAKRNLGTSRQMAPLTIGVGPGFTAGQDVDLVIESKRGHNLARIITEGSAIANTGVPGNIGGYTSERVIHAPGAGVIQNIRSIGDVVEAGQEIARIHPDSSTSGECMSREPISVYASISGIIRGLIREGYEVTEGFKIADIDPRIGELKNCFTISDKSRSIGGSVLEAVCAYANGVLG